MRKSFAVIFTFVLLGTAGSLFAVNRSAKIKELEQRIVKLEKALKPFLVQQKASSLSDWNVSEFFQTCLSVAA